MGMLIKVCPEYHGIKRKKFLKKASPISPKIMEIRFKLNLDQKSKR